MWDVCPLMMLSDSRGAHMNIWDQGQELKSELSSNGESQTQKNSSILLRDDLIRQSQR